MTPLRVATACAAILISLTPGCGGDGGSASVEPIGRPADVWARDFCTAFVTWADGFSARNDEMQEDLAALAARGNADFAELRRLTVDMIVDFIALTDEAAQAMRSAGNPAVENGAQMSSAVTALAVDLRGILVDWREKARDLPVDDPDRFVEGARELALGVTPQMEAVFSEEAIDERLPDLATPELREVFAKEPACARFNVAVG